MFAEQFGTDGGDSARSVAVSPDDGSPLVGGSTDRAFDVNGSSDPLNTWVNTHKGGEDAFLRKHARDGAWKWTRQFGSSLGDTVHDVAVAPDGSVYVAGYGNPANRNTTQGGAYIAKYNPDGTPATLTNADRSTGPWVRQFSSGRIWTFSVDPEGNPYIAVSINSDVYMYKLRPDGSFAASEPFGAYGCYGSAYLDIAFGSAVRGSADPSVYVTGVTTGYADDPNDCRLNNGTDELFLVKFDGLLNKKWHTQFGTNETNIASQAMGVAVDSEDRAYVVGHTFGTIKDPGLDYETKQGGRDAFIAKFSPGGVQVWGEQFGTTANDFVYDVAMYPSDNLYIVGNTAGTFEGSNLGAGGTDAFVSKYDKDGNQLKVRSFGSAGFDSARGVAHDPLTKSVLVAGNTDGALEGKQNKGGNDGFLVKVKDADLGGSPPSPPEAKKTPVIFVPGVAGTRLNAINAPFGERERWPGTENYLTLGDDDRLLDLRLAADGVGPCDDPYDPGCEIEVGDMIRTEATQDIYDSTIAKFKDAGYVEGKDLFPFPYDWRKHPNDVKGGKALYQDLPADVSLTEFIDYVQKNNPLPDGSLPKVDLLAHSRGGLITYDALRKDANYGKVRRVLTLGTPFLGGSAKALGVLQYQAGCFPADLAGTGYCHMNPATIQRIATNFPSIYELLPSRQFQVVEGSPLYVDLDEDGNGAVDGEKSYEHWTGIDANGQLLAHAEDNVARQRNAALMGNADKWHQLADNQYLAPPKDPNVEAVRVVGDSLATPEHVRKFRSNDPSCLLAEPLQCPIEYEYRFSNTDAVEGGDGTVALHSADLHDPTKGFDMRGEAPKGRVIPNFYAHNVEHGALATNENTLAYAVSFLEGGPESAAAPPTTQVVSSTSNFFSTRAAYAQETAQADPPADRAELARASGLDTEPQSFAGIELTVSGPASGFVTDGAGNRLGDTSETPGTSIAGEVQGGDYNRLGDKQSFFLNDPAGPHKLRLQAKGEERVELNVRTYESGRLTGQAAFKVKPAPAGTDLELSFEVGADLDSLRTLVDDGADSAVDRAVAPAAVVTGPAASETQAPTTKLSSELVIPETPRPAGKEDGEGARGRPRPEKAVVTLTADDGAAGSGVEATHYLLPGDSEARRYEGPFEVALGTAVRFVSIDKAGNAGTPKEVLVDDAPSDRPAAQLVQPGNNLTRYLDPKGDEDWFAFEADGRSSYRVQLNGLPADYDLELYDEGGNEVAASAGRGKRSEEVRENLAAGRYYVRISGHEGAWNVDKPYGLKVDTLGAR